MCLCCVTAFIIAAPVKEEQSTVIPIISLSAEYVADGKYKYKYVICFNFLRSWNDYFKHDS